jgi:signal transduction histidine kinase
VEKFADQLLEDGPQLRLDCPEQLPSVRADIDRVEQVLVNLLGNALTYTRRVQSSSVLGQKLRGKSCCPAIVDCGD